MEIVVKGVEFGYSSTPVLKKICLEIENAQLVSILGPNGVGKSTLIHCMNKILKPTAGTVLVDGEDVDGYSLKDLAKKIGYVPYSTSDAFPLSVIDTILMGRHPHSARRTTEKDLEKVYEVLELMGITHLAMRSFDELSAGQHQKVVLARGLAQEPEILLLDEPTSNLDIRHQMEVTRMLRDLSRTRGLLAIMISHDINIAARYSDNIIMMKDGSVFAVGSPAEVLTEENLKAVYGVDSEIVMDGDRPHVIIRDPSDDGLQAPAGIRCTSSCLR